MGLEKKKEKKRRLKNFLKIIHVNAMLNIHVVDFQLKLVEWTISPNLQNVYDSIDMIEKFKIVLT